MASQQHTGHAHTRKRHNAAPKFHANEVLRDTIEEFREKSDDVKTLVTAYVKEKPIKSLGIALLTGVALTMFLKR